MELNEKTEVTIPLKVLLSVVGSVVVAAYYAFATQAKIVTLENQINLQKIAFEEYRKQPSRGQLEVALIKKELDSIKDNIKDLQRSKKCFH